jgi:8-oxo-dGTP pyrophosphatase MutT (NUDIX family)
METLGDNLRESDRVGIIGENDDYKKYAVAIPLVNINDKLNVLLQVRAKNLNNQPGEISFPGGKIEKNENSLIAAIRETCEELNINSNRIETLGNLDFMITQHNKIIYPYVVYIDNTTIIKPSESEVDHIFYVPLQFFIESEPIIKTIRIFTEPEEEFPYSHMVGAMEYKWIEGKSKVYIYKYESYIIWGMTAKIMNHFARLILDKK